ncbi:hypothetical protein QFC19_002723 [Naganishia cerealis]|uniref:Uncharacterized protein n=1 Tax=Naganishia cerealis TaxID=610337 RepID=A0ACC2W9Q9_9TREE|nr:hypothetical protein QFC19_002723 [Naganishia cerealis]
MHLSVTQLVSTLAVVAGLTASTTSAHSIHRRGAQHHHKDLAERMAQPAATSTSEGDSTNFYARALNDAQAGRYRITRRSPNPAAGKPGQRKVIRKRGDGATCRIRSTANATESAVSSSSSADVSATSTSTDPAEGTNVNNWWAATTKASSSSAVPTPAWTSSSAAWSESSAWVEPSSSYAQYASSSASSYYSESPSSSSAAPAATETSTSSGHGTAINQVTNNVLLALRDATCGECGATPDAPNGSEDWINCGMKSANGWTPPKVTYDQLRVGDATKLQSSYPACSDEILAVMTQVSAETGGMSLYLVT